ncbi:GTPase [Psychroflexus salis]|uniref:GTPase n=1 Tax=Psychroflexus salis TaxID=1526574 RepID=A0A916ZUA3_9FLAO|nr:GTPase [Psychroflexus salis]GGE14523.1 hypothetical protein GCM10010831_14870 [Psychroflexus salis]
MALNKLIFVYNAHSNTKHGLLDAAKKILSPSTYDCKLCALTYGPILERKKWKKFRKESGISMDFLHKDECEKQFKSKFAQQYKYPVILIQNHYELDIFMNAKQINSLENLPTLIKEIEKRLKNNPN